MPTMIDIIGATILAGMVMLIIVGVTANLNQTLYMSTFSLNVQTSAIALARIIEHDFYKMGYDISKSSPVILQADSNRFMFWMGRIILPGESIQKTRVTYYTDLTTTGPIVSTTRNPRDRMFYRVEEASTISANIGVTQLHFTYFDSAGIQLSATNLPLSERLRIKAIRVKIFIESPEPVGRYSDPADTTYMGVYWEKLIYPRNL